MRAMANVASATNQHTLPPRPLFAAEDGRRAQESDAGGDRERRKRRRRCNRAGTIDQITHNNRHAHGQPGAYRKERRRPRSRRRPKLHPVKATSAPPSAGRLPATTTGRSSRREERFVPGREELSDRIVQPAQFAAHHDVVDRRAEGPRQCHGDDDADGERQTQHGAGLKPPAQEAQLGPVPVDDTGNAGPGDEALAGHDDAVLVGGDESGGRGNGHDERHQDHKQQRRSAGDVLYPPVRRAGQVTEAYEHDRPDRRAGHVPHQEAPRTAGG